MVKSIEDYVGKKVTLVCQDWLLVEGTLDAVEKDFIHVSGASLTFSNQPVFNALPYDFFAFLQFFKMALNFHSFTCNYTVYTSVTKLYMLCGTLSRELKMLHEASKIHSS